MREVLEELEKARMEKDRMPQVKICGLKRVEEALACVEGGASAVGCVFYPPSPRFVTDEEARAICRALPEGVTGVGVFVNESFAVIMEKVERCGLKGVQLHGQEPPELVHRLLHAGLTVVKAVYVNGAPSLSQAPSFGASAYLVECAGGVLPGGNAQQWDWGAALDFSSEYPTILAGGLNPENVVQAIAAASPDAVDVSSGVEAVPGRKDLDKVKRFLEAVSQTRCPRKLRRIFE
jgi:phosphoribosylanthranilate isomerase